MPSVAILGSRGYPSYYGGFETLVRILAPYLADQGWDVTVLGRPRSTRIDDPAGDPRIRAVRTRGIESRSASTLSYGLTGALWARSARPDVALVLNVANGYFLPILSRAGIPTVVNVDGIEWERAKWGRAARAVFRGGAALTARYGTTLVNDSEEIARYWTRRYGTTGTYIPYGGTDPGQLPAPEGLPSGGYILMVARFVPENTVPEFLAAAEVLADQAPVVIVGSSGYGGPLDEQARQLAASYQRIHWYGHVSDDRLLHSLWQHAGVYFHGHSVGGTNPALVQAMACGAPIVARDTVYNREVLGEAGRYTEPSASAITEAITSLLRAPAEQVELAAAARARAAERFTWENVCQQYDQVLRDAIALSRAKPALGSRR
ncbi:glycosyltransferase [Lolliginicoccus suaedae]|uniref:glycosyltransferase n=1 Tax=Lolliginicoccus suaedae TaxID=2605429 RepID=UPI0011EE15A3|nr:glycosyltransferase [Lolliginicoccus suaedae]